MNNTYYKKYLKYKMLYINLKNMYGGMFKRPSLPEFGQKGRNDDDDATQPLDELVLAPGIPFILTQEYYDSIPADKLIIINGIHYKLVCRIDKNFDGESRLKVIVLSSETGNFLAGNFMELCFYRSISDMDFFRLLYITESGIYEKGTWDYTQPTFIHLELQAFINRKWSELPEVMLRLEEYARIVKKPRVLEHIGSIDRIIPYALHRQLSKAEQGLKGVKCGKKPGDDTYLMTRLQDISTKLSDDYTIENITHLFDYATNMPSIFSMEIFCVNLKPKKGGLLPLRLYYIRYHVTNFLGKELNKEGYLPIFLTNQESKISLFGTYTSYVKGDYYICKVLEYYSQTDYKGPNIIPNGSSDPYVFIGERYRNLFPFNILYPGAAVPDAVPAVAAAAAYVP